MKNILFLGIFFSTVVACTTEQDAGPADANTFIKFIGGANIDVGAMVYETTDGGFIVLGTTETENDDGTSNFQIRVVKTDKNGNTIWDRLYPEVPDNNNNLKASALQAMDDGYLIIGDRIYSSGTVGMLLFYINNAGDETLDKTIPMIENQDTLSMHGIDLTVNDNNELKVMGQVESGDNNIYIGTLSLSDLSPLTDCSFSYSSAGSNTTLIKSLNFEDNGDLVFGVSVDGNARFIRVPTCQNSPLTGTFIQSESPKTYTSNQIVKSSTGYAMIGTTDENNNNDIFLARVNAYGDASKITIYTTTDGVALNNPEKGTTLAATKDGGLILAGSTQSGTQGSADILIMKTDFMGNVTWSRRFGDQNTETAKFITQTSDGGFLILCNSDFGGIDTMVLIKTDERGNLD